MNVKIGKRALTFKIRDIELEALLRCEPLKSVTRVGGKSFSVCIQPVEGGGLRADLQPSSDNTTLVAEVGMALVKDLSDMGKNREGITVVQDETSITLQVDIKSGRRLAQQEKV